MRRPALSMSALLVLLLVEEARAGDAPPTVILRTGDPDQPREEALDLAALRAKSGGARLEYFDAGDAEAGGTLDGVDLSAALQKLGARGDRDTLVIRCNDGYLSLLPVAAIDRFKALLAISSAPHPRPGRPAPAPYLASRGPVYLAFDHEVERAEDALAAAARDNGFDWGVSSLQYVRRAQLLSPTQPPPGSPFPVERGALTYQTHCLHCHAMHGTGGLAAWDLSAPNLFSYLDEKQIRAQLLDPRKKYPQGHMPAFKDKLSPSEIDALVAYLRAMNPPAAVAGPAKAHP